VYEKVVCLQWSSKTDCFLGLQITLKTQIRWPQGLYWESSQCSTDPLVGFLEGKDEERKEGEGGDWKWEETRVGKGTEEKKGERKKE